MDYLSMVDELLRLGLEGVSRDFLRHQLNWLETERKADGGFGGRRGDSDLYYTDFGARCLALLDVDRDGMMGLAHYLESHSNHPKDYVEWFNLLNIRRILSRYDISVQNPTKPPISTIRQTQYDIFLDALCQSMLQYDGNAKPPEIDEHLLTEDCRQTSLLAAMVGYLIITMDTKTDRIITYLDRITTFRHSDGGYLAHHHAHGGDLLSTYNAFLTLCLTEYVKLADLPALSRFVKSCANPSGGFTSSPEDPESDVEYTFYGLGLMGLIRVMSEKWKI